MAIRGIDTQMLVTKPAELTDGQSRVMKQAELHMRQTAETLNKAAEHQKERTAATAKTEGRRIGDDDENRRAGGQEQNGEPGAGQEDEQGPPSDPMLSLPVEKGKYARGEHHFIDIKL